MGFDNECILNIQTLAGEYFCPVCRLLVYPNEALQSQCTHLYCKPCLTYIVSTTRACPYDGYLVTEADSKLLVESNKTLAETIGKIAVHCLYHRSGCTWQGPLSECTSHCSGCAFGNSPVVCNRCGIQIVHRQVQEHAQNCPGVQPQVQQAEGAQDTSAAGGTDTANQTQAATQPGVTATQAQTTQTAATTASGQDPNQQANPNPQSQALVQSAVPTPEQWYQQQQQYQQYYQQYPGYDPYQQHYQQYYPYQQPGVPQYHQQHLQAHPPQVAGQNQPLLQPQSQPPPQTLVQPQSQPHPQPTGQPPSQTHAQAPAVAQLQNQPQVNLQQQPQTAVLPHSQIQSQTNQPAPGQAHPHPQPYPQAHPHPTQPHPQQHAMVPQYQQPHHQMQHLQPQPHSAHHQAPVQQHSQPHPYLNPNVQPQMQHPPAHDVTGHQSYPQLHQQMHLVAPQQHTMHMNPQGGPHPQPQHSGQAPSQFPQQHPPMRPPPSTASIPNQQQAALLPLPGQVQNIHPAQQQPVQQSGHLIHQRPPIQPGQQIMAQQHVQQQQQQPFVPQSSFLQQQMPTPSPLRPQVPPHSYTQHTHAYPHLQQNAAFSHGSQNVAGRPMVPNHAVQSQPYPQYAGGVQARPMHPGASQPSASLNNMLRSEIQAQVSTEQQSGATSRSTLSVRQGDYAFEKGMGDQTVELSSENAAKKVSNDSDPASTSALGVDASEVKNVKSETDIKSKDDCESHVLGNGGLVKRMVKEEGVESNLENFNVSKSGELVSEIKKDVSEVSPRHLGNFALEDRERKDDLLLKNPPLHEPEQIEKLSGKLEKDASAIQQPSTAANEASQTLTMPSAHVSSSPAKNVIPKGAISQGPEVDGYKGLPPPSQVHSGGFIQSSHPGAIADQGRHFGSSSLQQRPSGAPLLQTPPFVLPHHQHPGGHPSAQFRPQGYGHIPEHLQAPASKLSLETPPGGILGPGSTSSFGRGPGYYDFPQRNFESLPVVSQGPHGQGHALPTNAAASRASQGESVGGPPFGMLPPGVVDSRGGMMARPHGPEGLMGQQRPPNPMDAELFINHRPSYMDSRRPDPNLPGSLGRGSVGQPSGVMGSNGAPGLDSSSTLGFRDDRSKLFPDDRFNSFLGREAAERGEFEDGLKQFPRPSHLDAELGPKFGNYSSRPREMGPYGLNSDTGFKLGPGAGSAHSGFLPSYDGGERPVGLPDSGRNHPDFLGPVTGYARRHMNGLTPRSPIREYHGISSRGFGGIPGQSGLDDFDGKESRRFGDPIGNSFHESRFPILPGHLQRGEFEGPGKLRMGEHLGPRNLPSHLRLGEPIGFGDYPGHARMGELPGLGDFESFGAGNRPGHPRFRSNFSLQGFPNDRGINTGDTESFGNPRKRKAASTGWCRICKVDCQTVGGLELHSQTREHQKMAMDMVRTIKQNAKKQKFDPSSVEDASKSKNTSLDGHGNKH
ncbi:hypothetical protein I3843_13G070400 [Carya illinoinensis]|nr:hypothetical protein I3843_13G070400 [Carya illinoinensis]